MAGNRESVPNSVFGSSESCPVPLDSDPARTDGLMTSPGNATAPAMEVPVNSNGLVTPSENAAAPAMEISVPVKSDGLVTSPETAAPAKKSLRGRKVESGSATATRRSTRQRKAAVEMEIDEEVDRKRKSRTKSEAGLAKKVKKEDGVKSENWSEEDEVEDEGCEVSAEIAVPEYKFHVRKPVHKEGEYDLECHFEGDPVPDDEAKRRWPHHYPDRKGKAVLSESSKVSEEIEDLVPAVRHYTKALVDGRVEFELGDHAYVQAEEGQDSYICRIVEMFEGIDGVPYVTSQWFYRAKDTVMKEVSGVKLDKKRVFLSKIKNDNPLECLTQKLQIIRLPLDVNRVTKLGMTKGCDYYYDMMYLVPFSSFVSLPADDVVDKGESESTISSEDSEAMKNCVSMPGESYKTEVTLLDLYSGCGGMSTGLCLGANQSEVKLVTKWAVDMNSYACESLKLNHPETEVRNESAEDFLSLLKEWEKLCTLFLINAAKPSDSDEEEEEEADNDSGVDDSEIYEVEKVLSICYGDPKEMKTRGLYLKIRWKGYGPEYDTWEPFDGLSDCRKKIKEFVLNGYKSKLLPLPGDVDVLCGGPPCQGISGFNRFRRPDAPLEDEKNKQLIVYMDLVEYLKPRFVLMENVADILKFAKGYLGRYALARLVSINYQARIGLMAAGSYGLPQFRMRMFMWGAAPNEKLPQYPLPTHNVVVRGNCPVEYLNNAVCYDDGQMVGLEDRLYLGDALSDLPEVMNDERNDEMQYGLDPQTDFQRFIRLRRDEMPGCMQLDYEPRAHALYDHRPLKLTDDDFQRVQQIPRHKGANFRNLTGVRVRPDNTVELDPNVERVYLASGKPLVPDYAISFVRGKSLKPFGRLWWDETVPTVVTRAEPHNQAILHPVQDRVLTIRENARLQGFPDYYKLLGPIKERYIQVGNAVAVPVARALGYSLGQACRRFSGEEPTFTLPFRFPRITADNGSPAPA